VGGRSASPLGVKEGDSVAEIVASTFVLAVQDLNVSRTFFCQKLGFVEDLRVEGWSFLSRGGCRLRLGHCADASPISKCPDHSWFAYLHVRDIAGLYDEVRRQDVEIWHVLEDKPWRMREFAIVTPDGHRIVFGEPLV
jgi:catechol 2,3-dioxygenase-like lactoylglutathione lyase family enzyme